MVAPRTKMTRTGWCIMGQCEGTRPKSAYGNPMPTCIAWEICKCKCHKQITEMYKMADMPREPAEPNPEYHPPRRDYWMPGDPEPAIDPVPFIIDGETMPDVPERPVMPPPVAQDRPVSPAPVTWGRPASTPTGRKAKGQLEYEVLAICADFAAKVFDWEYCTPMAVSEEIGKRNAAEPPSTGAVSAVWDRWERMDFSEQAKKPSRFVRFKTEGSVNALERRKLEIKREKKRNAAGLLRGVRPKV